MKACSKCKKIYKDNNFFCTNCGTKLNEVFLDKQRLTIIVIVILVILFFAYYIVSMNNQINTKRKEIEDYKYEKALEEYYNTPKTSDLKINTGWDWHKDGNYIYIDGSVTNTSYSKNINYYEIEAKFYDKYGNMIDSDWTNGSDLDAGDTQKFDMMHKYDSRIYKIKLSVREVR